MFGNMAQLMQLLREAPRIKQHVSEIQQRLAEARYTGEAGGGQVRIVVDGKGEPQEITLEPELIKSGDAELIEELVLAAIRDSMQQTRDAAQREMQSLTGGVDLGPLMNMFGGSQP